jgi:hypothetical protein
LHRAIVCAAVVVCLAAASFGAVRGKEVMYVGGTLSAIPEKTEGTVDAGSVDVLMFTAAGKKVEIPYKGVTSLEYGQKAGRRVGVALAISPVALFSKKRKHYVSIGFTDASGAKQGAVFELGKDQVRPFVQNLETRSGQKVEFESEDAKKHFGN